MHAHKYDADAAKAWHDRVAASYPDTPFALPPRMFEAGSFLRKGHGRREAKEWETAPVGASAIANKG